MIQFKESTEKIERLAYEVAKALVGNWRFTQIQNLQPMKVFRQKLYASIAELCNKHKSSLRMTKFAERANSSRSQQTFAVCGCRLI